MIVDRYGHGVHVGERDCSVQRRHQKIVEESPSPAIDAGGQRRPLRGPPSRPWSRPATRTWARSSSWSTSPARLYFIEINCRIQVEHPVTEMLSGLDFVAEQIRIAAGEPLGYSQADVVLRGHAIEFRINAEDVAHDFRPQAGEVERYLAPGGPGVRMDSHLYPAYEVPPVLRLAARQAGRVGPRSIVRAGPRAGRPRRGGRWRASSPTWTSTVPCCDNETFIEGAFTTNLLDRVGSAAFVSSVARPQAVG